MENIAHIHEVLQMIFFSNKSFTKSSLIAEVIDTFGEDVLFTNCSEINMKPEEIIDFLISKNKIELRGEEIIPVGSTCGH